MKRLLSQFLVAAMVLSLQPQGARAEKTPAGGKKRVAVFTFADKTDHSYGWWGGKSVGDGMADMLTTALVKSGKYRVMEREQMEKLLGEQAFGASGAVTPESAAKMGKVLGVELAVFGSVTEFGHKKSSTGSALKKMGIGGSLSKQSATVGVDVRIVDVSSGEILKAETVRREKSKLGGSLDTESVSFGSETEFDQSVVGKAAREAVDDVVKLLGNQGGSGEWEAKVVMMKEDEIIINAGAEAEVKAGDKFVVYRKGEEMIDPDTGESLGTEESVVGKIQVVNNNVGGKGKASSCKRVSGSEFMKGDIVRKK